MTTAPNRPAADQMLRQTRDHHVQLSAMADMKANMLLTVSMLVITFTAPHVVDPVLRWPAVIVCISSLVTVVLAAYAVMPKIQLPGRAGNLKPDPQSPGFNILFFGNFTQLTQEQYEQEMGRILNDTEETYRTMLREVYTMGLFLAKKKYRFIRMAYTSFITGLVLSGITLVVSTLTAG